MQLNRESKVSLLSRCVYLNGSTYVIVISERVLLARLSDLVFQGLHVCCDILKLPTDFSLIFPHRFFTMNLIRLKAIMELAVVQRLLPKIFLIFR